LLGILEPEVHGLEPTTQGTSGVRTSSIGRSRASWMSSMRSTLTRRLGSSSSINSSGRSRGTTTPSGR
jgi:hypothetical protein